MGQGLEDRNRTGANAGAGVVGQRGRDSLELGLVVRSFDGTSLAAFPGLRGTGFRGLLLGLAFFVASDPEGFLLLVGEPGARVGGIAVAGGGILGEPGWRRGGRGGTVGWGGLWVPARAGASSLERRLGLASVWLAGRKGFLEEPVARSRGRVLGSGGLGVRGVLWIGFTKGREAGSGWRVGGTGFLVGGAAFVKEG